MSNEHVHPIFAGLLDSFQAAFGNSNAPAPTGSGHTSQSATESAASGASELHDEMLSLLKQAEEFIDQHSPEWSRPGETLLANIRAVISQAEANRLRIPETF